MTTLSDYKYVSNTIGDMYQREKDIRSKVGNIISIISDAPKGMQNPTSNVILKNYNITEDQVQNGIDNPYDLINLVKNLNESVMSGFGYPTIDNFLEEEEIKVVRNYAEISNIIGGIHHISESNIGEDIVFQRYLSAYQGLATRDLTSIQSVLDYAVFQGSNSYSYLVGRASSNPVTRFGMDQEYDEATDTWTIVELLLQECEIRNIDLWITFHDPRYFQSNWNGYGVDGLMGSYGTKMLFKKWFSSLAKLSVLNPRLKGIIWDDIGEYEFFQDTGSYTWNDSDGIHVLTVDYCRDLYNLIKAENPGFKMLWVCYEPYDYWTHDIWAERMPYSDGLVYAIYRYNPDALFPNFDPVHHNPVPYPLWADMKPDFLKKIYNEQKETLINNLLLPGQEFWYCVYATGTTGGGTMSEVILESQLNECMTDTDIDSIYYFTVLQDTNIYTNTCAVGAGGINCRKALIIKNYFENSYNSNYDDVAILVNDDSDVSVSIGDYFIFERRVNPRNIIRINCTTDEAIKTSDYSTIRSQIYPLLQNINDNINEINYIITTKGTPLRVISDEFYATKSFDWLYGKSFNEYVSMIGSRLSCTDNLYTSNDNIRLCDNWPWTEQAPRPLYSVYHDGSGGAISAEISFYPIAPSGFYECRLNVNGVVNRINMGGNVRAYLEMIVDPSYINNSYWIWWPNSIGEDANNKSVEFKLQNTAGSSVYATVDEYNITVYLENDGFGNSITTILQLYNYFYANYFNQPTKQFGWDIDSTLGDVYRINSNNVSVFSKTYLSGGSHRLYPSELMAAINSFAGWHISLIDPVRSDDSARFNPNFYLLPKPCLITPAIYNTDFNIVVGSGELEYPTNYNNYYGYTNGKFLRKDHDFYIMSRLDGWDYEDITKLIDNSGNADPNTTSGTFVVDNARGSSFGTYPSSDVLVPASSRGFNTIYEDGTNVYLNQAQNVLGYATFQANDSTAYRVSTVVIQNASITPAAGSVASWNSVGVWAASGIYTRSSSLVSSLRQRIPITNLSYGGVTRIFSPYGKIGYSNAVSVTLTLTGYKNGNIVRQTVTPSLSGSQSAASYSSNLFQIFGGWVYIEVIDNDCDEIEVLFNCSVNPGGYFDIGAFSLPQVKPDFTWVNGSIVIPWVSTNARTFNPLTGASRLQWQSLIAELVAKGVSGIIGWTAEPRDNIAAQDSYIKTVFEHYLSGYTIGESINIVPISGGYYTGGRWTHFSRFVFVGDPKIRIAPPPYYL